MIMVCDAIMGTGKSSAAITYLNEHPDGKYIYITPYLDEAKRIKDGCPSLHFVEPSDKLSKYNYKKSLHTVDLISQGRNIATTHQSFKNYTKSTLDDIKRQGYTLIIDENVDVLENCEFHPDDLEIVVGMGCVKEENGTYTLKDDSYQGRIFSEMFSLLRTRQLVKIKDKNENTFFYWTLPPELLTSFKDVFILTYLFEGQSLHHFMKIYDIPYTYIGIERTEGGEYRFGEYPGYVPEYVKSLKDMIEIVDNDRMNDVGDEFHALSMTWFEKGGDDVEQLKKNLFNFYYNIYDTDVDRRLWGSYKDGYNKLRGKGYAKAFLSFNAKATNVYRNRTHLAYVANPFMNVKEKYFYKMQGIDVDEELYATSIIVQWIWRSAIRAGEKIYIYVPSRRMRTLLTEWIENTSKGGYVNE